MSGSGTFSSLLAILLFILFTCSASGDGECKKSPIKTLNGKMEVSWKFDKANGKVVFTVTVHGMLDSQRAIEGWVALGFMQGPSKSPPAKIGAAADFVVTFLKSKRKVGIKDCNTITHNKKLSYDKQPSYTNVVKLIHITRKDNKVVFGIAREPNTKDKEDVPFTTGPMWLITSFGLDNINNCSKLAVSNIFDNKELTRVCILPPGYVSDKNAADNNSTSVNGTDSNAGSSWTNKAVKLAKHHWIGVIIGVAGVVTLVAVVVVYCVCRRSDSNGYKRNKVMSFYREKDEDDEARVSMLSAQMT